MLGSMANVDFGLPFFPPGAELPPHLPVAAGPAPVPASVPPAPQPATPPLPVSPPPPFLPPPPPFVPPPAAFPAWYPDWMTGSTRSILGHIPKSLAELLLAPYASNRPSRTTGPLMSGPVGGQVVGSALLALPLWIDYSMGNFSLPVQFPPGSVLLWIQMTTYAAWGGGTQNPAVSIGTANGTSDIYGPIAFPAQHVMTLQPMTGTLPFATDANPWKAWLTINGYSNTSGAGFLSLLYARY
jgi:hypothetical protein